jgi:hypothetical protein
MLSRTLLVIVLMLTTACGTGIKPEQIARVEESFHKIKPGMTKQQVEEIVGKPYMKVTLMYNTTSESVLICMVPPCSWDLWALAADVKKNSIDWPIVVFDPHTAQVIKIFRDDLELYFPI